MKRENPAYAVPVKMLTIVVCIFSVLSVLQTVSGVIVTIIAGVATYFVLLNLNVEFEYLLAGGGPSVDHILGRAKRKKIFDYEEDDIQIVAPVDSFVLRDYEKQGMKIKDFSSGKREAKVYALIYRKELDHFKVLIESNERMTGAMRRILPRRLMMQCNRYMGLTGRERVVGDSGMQAALATRTTF